MAVSVTEEAVLGPSVNNASNTGILSLAPSPINICTLKKLLYNYNEAEAGFLLDGFSNGFSMQYQGPRTSRFAKNLKSVREHPDIAEKKIVKEILEGRVAGPFLRPPFKDFIVSPIGIVPKKSKGEFRMIHHLSYPEGGSINDFIDPALTSVQYTHFDKAVDLIQRLGKNCHLFKMDIKNAFKIIPVRPEDFQLLGFSLNGFYFFDKTLPFGASISCATFERFSTFIENCVVARMPSGMLIHYLDDFLGGNKTRELCMATMNIFTGVLSELNVPIASEKTEGPTTVLTFLGLELDSAEMLVRIPMDKLNEVSDKIRIILHKDKAFLRDIQSLIGSLNFCCRAIPAGRPFCRRLINATCGVVKPFHRIRVNTSMKRDLEMWLKFFSNYNGISVFHDRFWKSNAEANFFTDSAGGVGMGFGIYFQTHWCAAKWPDDWHGADITRDITALELFPILVAISIWGSKLRNMRIQFNCDNSAVVTVLNTWSSKSERVMTLVRALTLECLKFNILVRASHLPGIKNSICDALSRSQMSRFRMLAPEADELPHPVPEHIWQVFRTGQPH